MKKTMLDHAQWLDWAADGFRTLFWINFALGLLIVGASIVLLVMGKPLIQAENIYRSDNLNSTTLNIVYIVVFGISSLLTSFFLRAAYILFAFLTDFANGLAGKQIKKEIQQNKPQ